MHVKNVIIKLSFYTFKKGKSESNDKHISGYLMPSDYSKARIQY